MYDDINGWHFLIVESDYRQEIIINQIDFPVNLKIQTPITEGFTFFVDAGIKVNVNLTSRFIQKGTYTTKGAYPIFQDVYQVIENNSYQGFETKEYNTDKEWEINPVNVSFAVSGGFKMNVNEKVNLFMAPGYMLSLNDITSGGHKAEYADLYNKKSPYQPNKIKQFALRIGLGFKFSRVKL